MCLWTYTVLTCLWHLSSLCLETVVGMFAYVSVGVCSIWQVCGGMKILFVEELWVFVLMCPWEYAVLACLW
jgi:hypothetical protein